MAVVVQEIQQFKLYCSLLEVNMQLHLEYRRIEINFFYSFHQQFRCFDDEYQLPIPCFIFKLSVCNMTLPTSCINKRSNSVAKCYNCLIIELVKLIIPYRRSFSSAWCCSALACVFDIDPAEHPTHDNRLACPYGAFAIIFTAESQFSYWFTEKNVCLSSSSCNF